MIGGAGVGVVLQENDSSGVVSARLRRAVWGEGLTCRMCMVSWCCVWQFLSHSGQMKAKLSSLVS